MHLCEPVSDLWILLSRATCVYHWEHPFAREICKEGETLWNLLCHGCSHGHRRAEKVTQPPEAAAQCPTFLIQVSASGTSLVSVGVSSGAVRTEQAPTALGGADKTLSPALLLSG